MATDRGAVLTIRAAARGVIDFSKARPSDSQWWRRTTILLDAIGKDDDEKIFRDVYNFHLALVSNSGLTEESFKQEQEKAREVFYDLTGVLRPWDGLNSEERKAREFSDLRQEYVRRFGDPNDPVVAAKLQEDIRQMMEAREVQKAVEDDMDRITRLQNERQARLANRNKQGRTWRATSNR